MNTLNKYIATDYLLTFAFTVLIFTFVMCVGTVIKAIDLVARGVSGWIILQVFAANIPFILTFTIPMSCLTTVLLLFSRMSLDGEITAMKACGLNVWQIIATPIALSILFTGVCIYLNSVAAPDSHFASRKLLRNVGVEEPVNLLEEGRFVKDFPGVLIYVGKKEGNRIKDVIVYEMDHKGVKRNVRAKSGVLRPGKEKYVLLVDLFDVRIDQPDEENPTDISLTRHVSAKKYPVRLDFSEVWDDDAIEKKVPDMRMGELIENIQNIREVYPDVEIKDLRRQRMRMVVSANERLALSVSCFAFSLFGIPLGMRSKRRESSVGVAVSLFVVFIFYLFIIIADSLVGRPELHPDMIIWIPVVTGEVLGFYLLHRMN